jgi:leader peptidase (prepilin peptidase) / N-methyltransferase
MRALPFAPHLACRDTGADGHKFQVVVITKCVITGGGVEKETALPLLIVTTLLGAVLLAIAVIDLRTFRIPDVLSLPLVLSGFVLAWLWPVMALHHHVIGAVAGYGMFALIGEVYFRRRGTEGLGLGDAKLFGAAGAWLGWQALPAVLLIASVSGLVFAVMRGRDHRVAFGPWLALGFGLVWMAQRHLGFW